MAGLGNPLTQQGNLNRVLTHIVITDFPGLNVSASYMSKSMATVTFDGPFVDQIPTATGIVNSPMPYVMGTIEVNLLRSQPLAAAWLTQTQVGSILGSVTAYPDSTAFPSVLLLNCSIVDLSPGAFDGADPTVKVTIKGVYEANDSLWTGITV